MVLFKRWSDNIVSNNNWKQFFSYGTRLLEETGGAVGVNRVSRNATIAVVLKYLSKFCRSLAMPLINWKVELKLKWTNHCVLSANGNDNTDADPNTIFLLLKTQHFMSL